MRIFFDDGNFNEDLDKIIAPLGRWDKPLVVMPTEKDARTAKVNNVDDPNTCHITFISYDYFMSKKWIADNDYDHIDFFRVDQFLMSRAYGVKVGCATVKRTMNKKEVTTEVKGEEE